MNGTIASRFALAAAALLWAGASFTKAQDALDPAAIRTRIAVMPPDQNVRTRAVIFLGKPTGADNPARFNDSVGGILARELFRQALLIAGRDELGLVTRDAVLGDAPAPGASQAELVSSLKIGQGNISRVAIRRSGGPGDENLLTRDLPGLKGPFGELPRLVEAAEALSRTEFPSALRKLGLDGQSKTAQNDAGLPDAIEARLSRLGYTETFAALRELHEAIRTAGESPTRLAGLVRGYTLLGLLTEHHWHPAHKAFKARALLYAQRMVARYPQDDRGLWHRAYAEALLGLHRDALADIAQARERHKAAGDPFVPTWAGLIEAYARSDLVQMNVPQGPLSPLAALLRLLVLEPTVLTDLGLLAGKDVLALDPECYRAYDAMCRLGELVNNVDQPTANAPEAFARTIPVRLGAMESLPAIVRARLDRPSVTGTSLFEALQLAGDPDVDSGEPSWSVLSRLLRETRFVQVERRTTIFRGPLGVMAGNYLRQDRAVVADHPYVLYLDSLATPRDQAASVLRKLADGLDRSELQLRSLVMLQAVDSSSPPRRMAWDFARRHVDNTAYDLSELVRSTSGREQSDNALTLLEISPHSHHAQAVLIENDWERARPHIAEWEQASNNAPVLLAALARRYALEKKVADVRRVLARYIQFSPDQWAYEMLAAGFLEAGDVERWQATLDEFLARTEDNGRSHAKVRGAIAEHFMALKDWDRAWPYAEAAATTGAQWALLSASRCAEARKDWDSAERFTRQISELNPGGGWAAWYLFCKRTGHGDAAAAGAFAERAVSGGPRPAVAPPTAFGYFYWLRGKPAQAVAYFQKAYDAAPAAATCVPLILISDELGDAAGRDRWIRTLLADYKKQSPFTAQIFEIFRKAGGPDGSGAIDLDTVDQVLARIKVPAYRGNNEFFVGCYLKNRGKKEQACVHLERALRSTTSHRFMRAIAADQLQRLGVDITDIAAGPGDEPPPANR